MQAKLTPVVNLSRRQIFSGPTCSRTLTRRTLSVKYVTLLLGPRVRWSDTNVGTQVRLSVLVLDTAELWKLSMQVFDSILTSFPLADERPYRCSQCGLAFRESGALTRHLKSLTPCTEKIRYSQCKEILVSKDGVQKGMKPFIMTFSAMDRKTKHASFFWSEMGEFKWIKWLVKSGIRHH